MLLGSQSLIFLDQMYGWHAEALRKGDKHSAKGYGAAIQVIRESSSRGILFERAISGREFAAFGEAMRAAAGQ